MKKRTLAVAALALAMTMNIGIMNSFAAEEPTPAWLVPQDTPVAEMRSKYGVDEWWKAEAIADAKAWAEANKGDIPSIADERARYEAIATKVCDFLTYDARYRMPALYYTLKDGRGVCSDYTTLAKALCDICGINARVSTGVSNGDGHDMLIVTLNGRSYYSDLSSHDVGSEPVLVESTPSYYREENVLDDLKSAAIMTGNATNPDSLEIKSINAAKTGMSPIGTMNGTYYVTQEDADAIDRYAEAGDIQGMYSVLDKYNIPHA